MRTPHRLLLSIARQVRASLSIDSVASLKCGATILALVLTISSQLLHAQSQFPLRPDDPRAVDFTREAFNTHADGVGDDAEALQQAVNRVHETTRNGVVLIPEGRYRLGRTVHVWQGIRLIGYGKTRPVFVLGANTPGFQEGAGRYMIHFADLRPQPGAPLGDGSEFTFYSGMLNIDLEMKEGNPAAIGVRFHVAQHSMLAHMKFDVGSCRAAVEDIGNQITDVHVIGGEFGIITKRTAPVWQFLLMDSVFEGQRSAGVHTMEAGFTIVRTRFANMPVALKIAAGEVEQLHARDLHLENISEAAFVAGNWRNPHSAVTLTNIACSNVPRFHSGQETVVAPSRHYLVEHFSQGLEIGPEGREQGIRTRHRERALSQPAPVVVTDIPPLPPMETWVNVRTLDVKAAASVDDTAALQAAIEKHPVLFFPSGTYRVSQSLKLKPNTVLIGLNPGTTRIALMPGSEAFAGEGDPLGVIVGPRGGSNIIRSISIDTSVRNPRAAGVVWMAGPTSMLDDVSFPVGSGGFGGPGGPRPAGTNARSSAPAPGGAQTARPGSGAGPGPGRGPGYSDTQAGDLIVRDGGGGIFRGCWPHDTNGKVGLRVENTSTPGKIYQMSVEHHMRIEAQFHNVRNWEMYAFQTEEENPAGALANAIDIQDSQDLLFANTYLYRVSRNVLPKEHAILVRRSDRIAFQNVKVFSQTRLSFDNAVIDEDSGVAVRPHYFTSFTVNRGMKAPVPLPPPTVFANGARLEKLAGGFSNASGLTASDTGTVFFTDAVNRKIYRWNEADKKAELLAETPGQPQVLGFVPPSTLLAVANDRAVYHLSASEPGKVEVVSETLERLPETTLLLPVGLRNHLWYLENLVARRGFVFRRGSNTAILSNVTNEHRGFYYAPNSRTAILAGGTWRPLLQSSQLAPFTPGKSHYLTTEDDGRTYIARLDDDSTVSAKVFAERGGTSVVADADGNVYVASGQVWIFDRNGREIGVLEVPERPASLAFGGKDRRTLFIGARSSLYSIALQGP